MSFRFLPAKRENTPLIIGLAGPTKSGKTYSAHRIAVGLAQGGTVAMINAEGAKGHQYSDKFHYLAGDITAPFRPARYTEALKAALALDPRPAVVIIDSLSHMHDGPGGVLEFHEDELDRLAGQDLKARQRSTWSAWVKPKADENEFIYTMLSADCHIICCFRAKEKLKLVKGKDPIELGWQPIAGERVAFETIFTLVLPPHSKGVPDLAVSEMREPFDTLILADRALDEETGAKLAAWAAGGAAPKQADTSALEHELVALLMLLGADHGVVDKHRGDASWLARNLARAQEKLAAQSAEGSTSEPDGPGDDAPRDSPLAEPGEPVDTDVQAAVSSDVVLIPVFGTGKSPKIGTSLADAGDDWVAWARQTAVATPDFFPDKFVVILNEWEAVPA